MIGCDTLATLSKTSFYERQVAVYHVCVTLCTNEHLSATSGSSSTQPQNQDAIQLKPSAWLQFVMKTVRISSPIPASYSGCLWTRVEGLGKMKKSWSWTLQIRGQIWHCGKSVTMLFINATSGLTLSWCHSSHSIIFLVPPARSQGFRLVSLQY